MSETKGLHRTKLPNGMEVAYVDKGVGKPIGVPRDRYEAQGYQPAFDKLPEQSVTHTGGTSWRPPVTFAPLEPGDHTIIHEFSGQLGVA